MPTPGSIDPETLRLFAGLLASPAGDSLQVLQDLSSEYPWLRLTVDELKTLSLEEWQAEHARLFISGHPKTVCPPFESAFLGGAMFGAACGQLSDLYRRAGLEAEGLPPDYLGTMLECAAWLAEQPCNHSRDLARELWQDHLATWVPRFSATLSMNGNLAFYRELGKQMEALFHD